MDKKLFTKICLSATSMGYRASLDNTELLKPIGFGLLRIEVLRINSDDVKINMIYYRNSFNDRIKCAEYSFDLEDWDSWRDLAEKIATGEAKICSNLERYSSNQEPFYYIDSSTKDMLEKASKD